MRNKIIIVGFLLTFSSCGIFIIADTSSKQTTYVKEVAEVDSTQKFIGTYDLTAYGIPGLGDIDYQMVVSKNESGLKTSFNEQTYTTMEILSTTIDEGILFIDIYVPEYGLNTVFEIYVDEDKVSGYLHDQFELEGTISR
jgi:hypothetical protein|tara:strand:+ start:2030 stop:2449 length:420 start_codon:yes stop_codon:yes gene_type:complete